MVILLIAYIVSFKKTSTGILFQRWSLNAIGKRKIRQEQMAFLSLRVRVQRKLKVEISFDGGEGTRKRKIFQADLFPCADLYCNQAGWQASCGKSFRCPPLTLNSHQLLLLEHSLPLLHPLPPHFLSVTHQQWLQSIKVRSAWPEGSPWMSTSCPAPYSSCDCKQVPLTSVCHMFFERDMKNNSVFLVTLL